MTHSARARIGARRQAREVAVQVLYQMDITGSADAEEALLLYRAGGFVEPSKSGTEELALEDFAATLVRGTSAHLAEIDDTLRKSTQHWRLDRMALVDRNVLRLAVYEIVYRKDVPVRVILNEAIEIAKRFGTEESASFVNGILDRIAHETGKR